MPINFGKKTAAKKTTTKPQEEVEDEAQVASEDEGSEEQEESSGGSGKKAWFKRGKESQADIEKYEKELQEKWEDQNRMRRFWLEDGEEARITFVDGDLDAEGNLDILTYREHHLQNQQGEWGNHFVCTAEADPPCPICIDYNGPNDKGAAGLVGVLTIIDHREFKSKKKEGVTYQYMPRLYVCTKNTIAKLHKYAKDHGGLAGTTWDVSRIGDKAPRVGSEFTFVQKNEIEDLQEHFSFEYKDAKTKKKVKDTRFKVADYEKELGWKPAKVLREQYGFGGGKTIGGGMPVQSASGKSKISFKGKM